MLLIRTRVQPSAIHGLGLFALEFVPCGTPVWRFQAGFDQEFLPQQIATLPEVAREHLRWFGFPSAAEGRVFLSIDGACYMNHSSTPNTGAAPNAVHPVTTVALRDIAVGEEITCDYFAFDADAARKLGEGGS